MNRLDCCKSPILNNAVLKSLFSKKIFSVQDFLEQTIDRINAISGLSSRDIITLRQSLITNYSGFPRKGIDEYLDLIANSLTLQTGIKCLDDLMGEELMTGNMIEVCGLSGSFKTQLSLTVSINISLQIKKIVHYIDSSPGTFTADRIENMLESRKLSKEVIKDTMERIKITKVTSMHDLVSTLHNLKTCLGNEETSCRMIVIDSLSSLYLPLLNETNNSGLSFINHVASLIRFISKQFHLLFLVVNLATKFFDPEATLDSFEDAAVEPITSVKELRPTLGRYWLHVPNTRLLLLTDGDSIQSGAKLTITVLKSSSIPINSSCLATVTGDGIVDFLEK